MDSLTGDRKPAHVLVIPDAQHGHIAPMLRLVKHFARKGITITFVIAEADIPGLTLTDSSSEQQGLDFRVIRLSTPGKKATPSDPHHARIELQEAFEQQLMGKLVRDKISGFAGGPTSIFSDMFLPWTQDAAQKLQIPRYMFVPSGVIYARHMQAFVDQFEHGELRASEIDGKLVKFDGQIFIPGLPPLRYHDLSRSSQTRTATFLQCSKSLWQSAGVLVNSFYELEEKVIESWPTPGHPAIKHKKVPKIYPVGPLLSAPISEPNTTVVNGLDDSADKSLVWLGSQPLYVAFGSQAYLSQGQITELAHGLQASNQRFLWVLPQPKSSSNKETPSITTLLPPGFDARIGDRGCIVKGWAPQVQILAHSSTGGFLTHAGWNSSLESIMLGVPMIAWPQAADQYLNCRYLVDVLKIADQIRSGAENIVERSEVERAVRLLILGSEGKAMRKNAEELQRKGAGAVATGGSLSRAVEDFMRDISSDHHV